MKSSFHCSISASVSACWRAASAGVVLPWRMSITRAALRLAVQRYGLSASASSSAWGSVWGLDLLMAEVSCLSVGMDGKGMGVAPVNMLCCGYATVLSRLARQDLRCACAEHVHGVDMALILDQFGELITCPVQEGDGAGLPKEGFNPTPNSSVLTGYRCDWVLPSHPVISPLSTLENRATFALYRSSPSPSPSPLHLCSFEA